jgi:hypothetical protein
MMLAATILSTATSLGASLPAEASTSSSTSSIDLVSPATTVIETTIQPPKVIRSSIGTFLKISQTAYNQKDDLLQSIKRLETSVSSELTSTQVWKEIYTILQKYYDSNIHKQISIRPPADIKSAFKVLLEDHTVNLIVNGEIVQVSVEYKSNTGNAAADTTTTSSLVPDDEWILRIEGYRGIDPTAADAALTRPRYDPSTPKFVQEFWDYYQTPYPTKYLSDFLINEERPVTYGDILVFQGSLAVAFVYAWSYAYYVRENDPQEKAAKTKQGQAKQKKVGAALSTSETKRKEKKPAESNWASPPPPADSSATAMAAAIIQEPKSVAVPVKDKKATKTPAAVAVENEVVDDEADDDVKVSIDFDSSGQVVITASETRTIESRDGVLAFVQALYFPWLGMLIPNLTEGTITTTTTTTSSGSSSDDKKDERKEGFFSFLQALYFPWLGILQGK